MELKARFDERANIRWARALEEAGVHVVYGHPALKTHAKAILVVRREGDGVRHYVHVGTGNYHPRTARLYTDFGLFTCDERPRRRRRRHVQLPDRLGRPRAYRKVLVAPDFLRDGILERDRARRSSAHREGRRGAHRDEDERARRPRAASGRSTAPRRPACPVDLNIRGICCLVPGVPGVSENIRVVSVVGRFLEHSRIFAFAARRRGVDVLIGSADLMPRNLDKRVELVAPVRGPAPRDELLDTLERCLADNANAWDLAADGTWTRRAGPRAASSRATSTRSSWQSAHAAPRPPHVGPAPA